MCSFWCRVLSEKLQILLLLSYQLYIVHDKILVVMSCFSVFCTLFSLSLYIVHCPFYILENCYMCNVQCVIMKVKGGEMG